jgi:hypothetical protein
MWFDPGLAGLFITSTLLHLGEDINLLVVSVVEKEKLNGKRRFKIFFFPASACAGKKENSDVQHGTVSVFFL